MKVNSVSDIQFLREKIAEDRHNAVMAGLTAFVGLFFAIIGLWLVAQSRTEYEYHLLYTLQKTVRPFLVIGWE